MRIRMRSVTNQLRAAPLGGEGWYISRPSANGVDGRWPVRPHAVVGMPTPTAASRAAPIMAAASPPAADMVALLMQRGDAALAVGDIIAARLLFERAATMGSAAAAIVAGKTYDVDFLLRAGARGIRADPVVAAAWFRKAAALGDPEARERLARIDAHRPR